MDVIAILETSVLVGWIMLDAYAYRKFWTRLQDLTEAVQELQQEVHMISHTSAFTEHGSKGNFSVKA